MRHTLSISLRCTPSASLSHQILHMLSRAMASSQIAGGSTDHADTSLSAPPPPCSDLGTAPMSSLSTRSNPPMMCANSLPLVTPYLPSSGSLSDTYPRWLGLLSLIPTPCPLNQSPPTYLSPPSKIAGVLNSVSLGIKALLASSPDQKSTVQTLLATFLADPPLLRFWVNPNPQHPSQPLFPALLKT